MLFRSRLLLHIALTTVLTASSTYANLSKFIIDSRKPLKGWGGPNQDIKYEVIKGHFTGEIDPDAPENAIITDLALAPRNVDGKVEYSSNFAIVKPVDISTATGVLYDMIPNRGNGESIAPDGDGHVRVMTGWQGDTPPEKNLYTATVPIARNEDGTSITGPVFVRFVSMRNGVKTLPLVRGFGEQVPAPTPASLDTGEARLFCQTDDYGEMIEIPSSDWAFSDCSTEPFPGRADPTKVSLKGGFSTWRSYGLVYTGKDPLVLGIGFAATRDFISFLRYASEDRSGTPNPLAEEIEWAISTGTSQSGNFLRTFLHLGFNADESGRIVFDGMNPNIGGRLVPLNLRFGLPGGAANRYELGSEGVLWWGSYTDATRGLEKASLLDRAIASDTCPKIVETFGSAEIWNLRMSPGLVGTDAVSDIPLPSNVRRYYYPGVTHGGAREDGTGGFVVEPVYGKWISCELPDNPNQTGPLLRAAIANLIAWVKDGVEPPPSAYPTIANGDLVAPTAEAMGFPALPGGSVPDGKLNPFVEQDAGKNWNPADLSGTPNVAPPRFIRQLPTRVPRVNEDGNETSGIATVLHRLPLGTYTGWNGRTTGYYKGKFALYLGGFIPFAKTKADRLENNDPRLSLEERYGTHGNYVDRVRAVTAEMLEQRLLLPGDAAGIVAAAEGSNILR